MAAEKKTNPQSESMNDYEKLLHSLKSLNSMLLKEIVEKRQEVDSLKKVNVSLESELNVLKERYLRRILEEEERVMDDDISCSVKDFFSRLEYQIGEEKFILSKVCAERDELKEKFDESVQVVNELRLKLSESEKRASAVDGLVKEEVEMERKMGLLVTEKEAVEKNVIDLKGVVDELKRNIDKIVKEKTAVEGEREVLEDKKNELQSSVDGLNQLVNKFRKSEEDEQ